MTAIEQLKDDIATLEAAEGVFQRKYGRAYIRYNVELEKMNEQLAKLERCAKGMDCRVLHRRAGMSSHLQALSAAFGAEIDAHLERPEPVPLEPDPIKHPNHYTSHPSGIEPIEVCKYETFNRGNILKYVMRAPYKGSELQDLKKARQYLEWEINRVEEAE